MGPLVFSQVGVGGEVTLHSQEGHTLSLHLGLLPSDDARVDADVVVAVGGVLDRKGSVKLDDIPRGRGVIDLVVVPKTSLPEACVVLVAARVVRLTRVPVRIRQRGPVHPEPAP